MKVIIELTLLTGISTTLLVLILTSKRTRQPLRFTFLGCVFASCIGLVYPIFDMSGICLFLLFISTLSCVNLLCFKYGKFALFLEREVLMCFFTFLFGGGCMAIQRFLGDISLLCVNIVCICIFAIGRGVLKFRQRREIIDKFTYSVLLKNKGEEVICEGFLDSGNMLYDTISKKPIMLVDFDIFHKLYSNISYFNVLSKTFDENLVKNGHYIKVNSLSVGASMLVFSIDEVVVGENRRVKDPMLGLSLSGFEKSFGRSVLLHSELV